MSSRFLHCRLAEEAAPPAEPKCPPEYKLVEDMCVPLAGGEAIPPQQAPLIGSRGRRRGVPPLHVGFELGR